VIDDAVVVLENIFRYIEEKGMPPFQAAIEGTREIGMRLPPRLYPCSRSFCRWVHGRHRRPLHVIVGFTSSFAIAVSLIVSFTLTPMLAARMIKRKHAPATKGPSPDTSASPEGQNATRWPSSRQVRPGAI